MKVFLDANVFIYAASAGDRRAEPSAAIVRAVSSGELDGHTSVAVLEEVFHIELTSGEPALRGLARDSYEGSPSILPVPPEAFEISLSIDVQDLGANDRLHVATCRVHGIDTIVTADRAFDGVDFPRRLDPLDAPAQLLG